MKKLIIYTDGGARNNPGPAGIGVVFCDEKGKVLEKFKKYIGEATNNQAEYKALIFALEKVKNYNPNEIECRLDSELIVKQLNQEYKVKNSEIKSLFNKVHELIFFKPVLFKYIPREKNKLADELVNKAIDDAIKK